MRNNIQTNKYNSNAWQLALIIGYSTMAKPYNPEI